MKERRSLGGQPQRMRVGQGISIESAAARAKMTPEQWQTLEAENATVYTLMPRNYADAAKALGLTWTLVYS